MNRCVIGLQWGDEGKGKVVDIFSESADVVVRYSGGANAGHSVVRKADEDVFALHLLPSGILRENLTCVIGGGVVLDAEILLEEIAGLARRGINVGDSLKISSRAQLVMDYHKQEDQLSEDALGSEKLGTTIRGIGPCYGDKVNRSTAMRVGDLLCLDSLRDKLERIVDRKNRYFAGVYGWEGKLDTDEIFKKCQLWADALGSNIVDSTALLHEAWQQGKNILCEGAQGSLLDLDHGTFPFVTSSNSSSAGMSVGTGLPAKAIDRFVGVVKAYTSRVGAGPFPTEQDNDTGQCIRDKGHEYGTTTGRPRRCGWFDAVSVGYSIKIGGIDELVVLHLDTLAGMKELKICTSYRHAGKKITFFPAEAAILSQVQCEYETLAGFEEDISGIDQFDKLPSNAREYVERLEAILGTPVTMIGVGPGREQTINR